MLSLPWRCHRAFLSRGVVVQCNGFLLKLCCVLHTADAVCGLPDLEETEPTEKEAEPVPPPPCPLLDRQARIQAFSQGGGGGFNDGRVQRAASAPAPTGGLGLINIRLKGIYAEFQVIRGFSQKNTD